MVNSVTLWEFESVDEDFLGFLGIFFYDHD